MKNIRSFNLSANRCTGLLILILILCLGMITGCKKKKDDSPGPGSQPYYNMSDTSTRQIIASIPRIELSRLKSTMVNLYLSVTDQDGKPFTDFNQYNFFIKQICVGSKDTAMVASGSFSKLNETGSNIATPLVLDYSGSMTNYIGDLEQAAGKFTVIKNGSDQVELIKFSSTIENIHPFTSDTTALLQALRSQWEIGRAHV